MQRKHMAELFTIGGLSTLAMLILLQAVLGFDNLLYISIESKRAPEDKQQFVRRFGIGLAIALRLVLLFAIMAMIDGIKEPLFGIHISEIVNGDFTLHSLITLVGAYSSSTTAVKEVLHLLAVEHIEEVGSNHQKSIGR